MNRSHKKETPSAVIHSPFPSLMLQVGEEEQEQHTRENERKVEEGNSLITLWNHSPSPSFLL
jgi:hypothetical protein